MKKKTQKNDYNIITLKVVRIMIKSKGTYIYRYMYYNLQISNLNSIFNSISVTWSISSILDNIRSLDTMCVNTVAISALVTISSAWVFFFHIVINHCL